MPALKICRQCGTKQSQALCPRCTRAKAGRYRDSTYQSNRALLLISHPFCLICLSRANTADHLHPISKGGTHSLSNLVAMCERCNKSKGSKTLQEFIAYRDARSLPVSAEARRFSVTHTHP